MTTPGDTSHAHSDQFTLASMAPHQPRRRRPWIIPAAIAAAVALAAGSYLAWTALAPTSFTVHGSVTLVSDDNSLGTTNCSGRGGYSDMRAGTAVTVTDAAGTVVALGALQEGHRSSATSTTCVFPFEVADVPAGHRFYGIEISHRGRLQYPEEQVRDAEVMLSLGDD